MHSAFLRACDRHWPHYIRHYGIAHGGGIYTPTHTPFLVSQGFPTNQYFRVSCLLYQYVKGRF